MLRYAIAIFTSAFLLFQVQPLIGRYILPWFGGTPAVWTTCLLFFQVLLLGGYAYAHGLIAYCKPRTQAFVHLALLAGSVLLLPIVPAEEWKPTGEELPTAHILLLLAATIGGPYLVLSSTGPLLQAWFARESDGASPYRLYSLSNIGSLLALVSYPFIVEPALALGVQAYLWSAGFVIFALTCGWCAWSARASVAPRLSAPALQTTIVPPRTASILTWIALAMTASVMLLATTNQMCQEVAVVPFLWVLPLALYLISFILCFDSDRWYSRNVFAVLLALFAPLCVWVFQNGEAVRLELQVGVYSATLFAACMICHGELARSRPNPRYLTLFYLMIATGGALGGVFVALVAPRLFTGYWEFYLALAACFVLLIAAYKREQLVALGQSMTWRHWALPGAMFGLLIVALGMQAQRNGHKVIDATRNFYGVLRVVRKDDPKLGAKYSITHGRIEHGSQFQDPDKRNWATAVFGPDSGIALALNAHPARQRGDGSLRVGVIGLGAGAMLTYGRDGDDFRYYEINPEVTRIAREHFTFLDDTQANVEIVHGDGRIQLERELATEHPERFDLLVVDAFSSDAIPMHLLTLECAQLYWRHLQPDGILAINISNRHLDLKPVVRALAEACDKSAVWIRSYDDPERGTTDADWVLITANQDFVHQREVLDNANPWTADSQPLFWTDDFSSLKQVLAR